MQCKDPTCNSASWLPKVAHYNAAPSNSWMTTFTDIINIVYAYCIDMEIDSIVLIYTQSATIRHACKSMVRHRKLVDNKHIHHIQGVKPVNM